MIISRGVKKLLVSRHPSDPPTLIPQVSFWWRLVKNEKTRVFSGGSRGVFRNVHSALFFKQSNNNSNR